MAPVIYLRKSQREQKREPLKQIQHGVCYNTHHGCRKNVVHSSFQRESLNPSRDSASMEKARNLKSGQMSVGEFNALYYSKKQSGHLTQRRNLSHNKSDVNSRKDLKNPFSSDKAKSSIMSRETSAKQSLNKSKLQHKAQAKNLQNKKEGTTSRLGIQTSHEAGKSEPIKLKANNPLCSAKQKAVQVEKDANQAMDQKGNLNSNNRNLKDSKLKEQLTNPYRSKRKGENAKLNTERVVSSKRSSFSSEQQLFTLQKLANKEEKKNRPLDAEQRQVSSVVGKPKALNRTKAHASREASSKSKVYEASHCAGRTSHSNSIDNPAYKFGSQAPGREGPKESSADARRSINKSILPLKRNLSSAKTSLKMVTSRLHSKIKGNDKGASMKSAASTATPLSRENLEKFERLRGATEIAGAIKDRFKKHNEAPATKANFYRIGRLLGKGAFGKVNLGMHKLTGKYVAIKSIKKSYLTDKESKERLLQEFSILKGLYHPNISRLYESFESEKHVLIVTELCSGQDLLNYIRKHKRLDENTAKSIFKSLIAGLHYCHTRRIVHRDIKLDNLLLTSKGELKICDFGVSRVVGRGEVMTERCGTPAYMAPEILRDKGYKGFGADMWSAGVVLYAMLYGTVPFKATTIKELHRLILKGKIELREDISEEARDLLRKLLERNPKRRANTSEVIRHQWMQRVNSVPLFTEEQREALERDCWESGKAGRCELFTEQEIDSTLDELARNNTTKSVVLAPFNTTLSEELDDSVIESEELVDKVMVLRFSSRAKDIDRQYEKNNNGDIDNGIYTKFLVSSSKQSVKDNSATNESFDYTPSSSRSFSRAEEHKEPPLNSLSLSKIRS